MDRFPTKANALAHLKAFTNGEIRTVVDVGVLTGTADLINVFPDCKHVLIEPIQEFFETITENYAKAKVDYDLLKIALSNSKGTQRLEKRVHLPGLARRYQVTASNLIFGDEELADAPNVVTVETDTVDNVLRNYEGPFLLKIDVDGAEFQILEGLNQADQVFVVVVESWTRRISEFISVFEEKGFALWDITDLCYMRGQLSQVDLVFVNKRILFNERYKELTPRKFGYSSGDKGNYYALTESSLLLDKKKMDRLLSIPKTGKV